MTISKSHPILSSLLAVCFLSIGIINSVSAHSVLDYKISLAEDGETYEVWMRPKETPMPDLSLSGQVTIKVPHQAAFRPVDVVSLFEHIDWIESSRIDAPVEAPDADYISFSFFGLTGGASLQAYQWEADQETLVFTFKNHTGCVDDVSIIANDDPFNIENNSSNANIANHFVNLGWGEVDENHFSQVYGKAVQCSR